MRQNSHETSPGSKRASLHIGRVNQKRRTQRALMEAALALRAEGISPTLEQVAERALVSRATVYRYFSSAESLLAMAQFDRAVPAIEEVFKPGDDPVQAIGRATERINRLLHADERGVHALVCSAMQVWLETEPDSRPPRPGRRMQMIEPIVAALASRLDATARRRLRAALSLVMGAEAVVSLRDVAGESANDAVAYAAWAARALMRQALDEARARPAATGKLPGGSSNSPGLLPTSD